MTKQKRFVDTTQLDTTYTNVEGSYITVTDSLQGNIMDIEILGNTIQDPNNLEDIKSVGKALEDGTFELELKTRGSNLFDGKLNSNTAINRTTGVEYIAENYHTSTNFIPINEGMKLQINKSWVDIFFYDVDFKLISTFEGGGESIPKVPSHSRYCKFYVSNSLKNNIKVEINNLTPFTPYVSSSSKIKLPVQLEKVGDVSDRLFRREDGVWCIEKNIKNIELTGNETYTSFVQESNTLRGGILNAITDIKYSPKLCVISDKLQGIGWNDSPWLAKQDSVSVLLSHSHLYIYLTEVTSKEEYINKIKKLMPYIKYVTNDPQIIELPFDTQIHLNSFFGTTHIFSEGSEVEPIIKGRIAKSIGASIESINEKIDDVNKEVQVIKNLEDTTLSTITTDKSSVSIRDTKEGYMSEVKLEGKTVVNYSKIKDPTPVTHNFGDKEVTDFSLEGSKQGLVEVDKVIGNTLVNLNDVVVSSADTVLNKYYYDLNVANCNMFKSDCVYTLIYTLNIKNDTSNGDYRYMDIGLGISTSMYEVIPGFRTTAIKNGINIIPFTFSNPNNRSRLVIRPVRRNTPPVEGESITYSVENLIILEGDYTNKPIPTSCFEGMQSTFEDKLITQEMVDSGLEKAENLGKYKANVKVVGKNLFDGEFESGNYINGIENTNISMIRNKNKFIKLKSNTSYIFTDSSLSKGVSFYDKDKKFINQIFVKSVGFTTPSNGVYINFYIQECTNVNQNIQIEEGTVATTYEPYKEFIQTLYLDEPLYANNELCVHDGKLGYWKNYEKIVFDGSDDETVTDIGAVKNETTEFRCGRLANPHNTTNMICDKFKYSDGLWGATTEGFFGFENSKYAIDFRISNFRLSTIDAKGFREWLQANPTTVIYELAEPIFVPVLEDTPQWILDSYNSCSMHLDTNISPSIVKFKALTEELPLKSSTKYVVDFTCDITGEPLTVNLGGTITEITSALSNRVELITPSVMLHSNLEIDGQRVKVSLVQVTEKYGTESYVEGIKSVGDGVDKVEILSNSKNLFNKNDIIKNKYLQGMTTMNNYGSYGESQFTNISNYMKVKKGYTYTFSYDYETLSNTGSRGYCYYDENKNLIPSDSDTLHQVTFKEKTFTPQQNGYMRIAYDKNCINIQFEQSNNKTSYVDYNINKNVILYQDSEGNWKKPILRGVGNIKDTIELHSDGKYYYHKRNHEIVFNGSESWSRHGKGNNTLFSSFALNVECDSTQPRSYQMWDKNQLDKGISNYLPCIGDELYFDSVSREGFSQGHSDNVNTHNWCVCIKNMRLTESTVEGFKEFLAKNPIVLIYGLLKEEVYPCTELTLDTYKEDTNYFINSGVISPTSTLKLSQNINGVVNILKDKTEVLEKKLGLLLDNVNTTITTKKSLETIPGTVNGYANNLLIEGRTLNNLFIQDYLLEPTTLENDTGMVNGYASVIPNDSLQFKPGEVYTLITNFKVNVLKGNPKPYFIINYRKINGDYYKLVSTLDSNLTGVYKFKIPEDYNNTAQMFIGLQPGCSISIQNLGCSVYKGDLTSNPPSYIKGLGSTGEGVNEATLQTRKEALVTTKTIKYLDSEGQLKVPILRRIDDVLKDTIELHSDGNYYYHKRTEKVVITEESTIEVADKFTDTTRFYTLVNPPQKPRGKCISNLFKYNHTHEINIEGVLLGQKWHVTIEILNSRLITQDVEGFKAWLQSNPVEVIYELATEKVYPCTNLDLVTYEGTTNLAVNFGAISPKITFTLQNNLYDSFKLMQLKVAKIESKFNDYMITQNLRQLRTTFRSDYANFSVTVVNDIAPTSVIITSYAEDLFELFKEVITNGEDSYDRIEVEEYIDFYVMSFVFSQDMAFELFDLIEKHCAIEGDYVIQ